MAVRLWIRLFLWRVSEGGVRRLLPVTLQRTGVRVLSINAGATFLDRASNWVFPLVCIYLYLTVLRTIYDLTVFCCLLLFIEIV
jgi:hypothetical protein